jgi:hypothetical protein
MTRSDRSTKQRTSGEAVTDQSQSQRLTFRQKFWLFGVGVPVLLMVLLFVLAVFLPKSPPTLNSTEKMLLGRWKVVGPDAGPRDYIRFEAGYAISESTSKVYRWEADEHSLYFRSHDFWSRLNNQRAEWRIEHLSDDEVRISYASGGDPISITYQRDKSAPP